MRHRVVIDLGSDQAVYFMIRASARGWALHGIDHNPDTNRATYDLIADPSLPHQCRRRCRRQSCGCVDLILAPEPSQARN